ncbi:ranscriptional regulator [Kocuria dechangensis]|uniref:Ranscriptional regulator n=1 Tax=Kocuria dechangensis TaxID=1176249 RepID=A0A917GIE4_9MICC|nr:MarR family transcriptional regulator [Kocuria dechangensis]GGG46596.1 ranscriptional regulator [Kocuria dechangensis]
MTPRTTPSVDEETPAVDGIERLAHTDLATEPFFLAARLASTGSAGANRMLAELGLKVRHYSVLALACSGEEPTQRELSQFLVLDPSQIVSIIDELEQRGAVERRTDPRDRRSKILAPTAAGHSLYAEAKALVARSTEDSLTELSAAERDELFRLLRKAAL